MFKQATFKYGDNEIMRTLSRVPILCDIDLHCAKTLML